MKENGADTVVDKLRKHRAVLGSALIIVALMMVGLSAWTATEQQHCNEAFAKNFSLYVRLENRADQAEQGFWRSVYEHPNARRRNIAAFKEWVETFEETDRLREDIDLVALARCE